MVSNQAPPTGPREIRPACSLSNQQCFLIFSPPPSLLHPRSPHLPPPSPASLLLTPPSLLHPSSPPLLLPLLPPRVRVPAQHSPIHALIHTPTAVSTMQGDSQLVWSSQDQERLDTQLGRAGDRTSNLPLTSQPALLPEPLVNSRRQFDFKT